MNSTTVTISTFTISILFLLFGIIASRRPANLKTSPYFVAIFWVIALSSILSYYSNWWPEFNMPAPIIYFYIVLIIAIVGVKVAQTITQKPEVIQYRHIEEDVKKPLTREQATDINKTCCFTLTNPDEKRPPYQDSGNYGNFWWHLCLAPYYEWDLSYKSYFTGDEVVVEAITKGRYSGNFGFGKKKIKFHAERNVKIQCRLLNGQCLPMDASSGPQVLGDWGFKAEANITSSIGSAQELIVEAYMKVAVEGHSSASLKASIKGVGGPEIKIARGGWPNMSDVHKYRFVCYSCK